MHESSASGVNDQIFSRHNDSVLCCSINDLTRVAVSGGIDDTAFVWDLNTKHVIFECIGHKESVVAAAFSLNSTYVATGDLNGYIQVRNTTTGIKIFDFDIDEINWILWHNTSEFVLLAGTKTGDFWMWNVNDPAAMKTFPSFGAPTTAAKLLSDGMAIVTAYADGSLRVFDLKTKKVISNLTDQDRAEIISLDLNPNKALIAVGCVDSSVKLITLNTFKTIRTLHCKSPRNVAENSSCIEAEERADMELSDGNVPDKPAVGESEQDQQDTEPLEVIDEYTGCDGQTEGDVDLSESDDEEVSVTDSVESVLFSRCGTYLAAANNSGSIIFWDVSSLALRCEIHTGIGITRCAWSDDGNYITGCLDGVVRIYDTNLNTLNEISLHTDQILDLAYRKGVLVTASEDKTCRAIALVN